jgi:hypothetical protein
MSGMGIALDEQVWQKVFPHERQWCFLFVSENATRHLQHTSESDHLGGCRA